MSFFNEIEPRTANSTDVSTLDCIITAIKEAVEFTDFFVVYIEYEDDLNEFRERIAACKNKWTSTLYVLFNFVRKIH